jgi:hypothetical protein
MPDLQLFTTGEIQVSVHELVTSIREYFHPSLPQLTEQEMIEIRNRLRDLACQPAEQSHEAESETVERLPIRRDQ